MTAATATIYVRRTPGWRKPSAVPGFGPTFGFTIFYLSAIVLIPLFALIVRPWELGWQGFADAISTPRVAASRANAPMASGAPATVRSG